MGSRMKKGKNRNSKNKRNKGYQGRTPYRKTSQEKASCLRFLVSDGVWRSVTYAYLLLPFLIFVLGWLKWYFAIPIAAGVGYAFFRAMKAESTAYDDIFRKENAVRLLAALAIIVIWVVLSGIGGICFQNRDHGARTTIYRALVDYDWPVVAPDGTRTLIYYIGFWIPSALVGKLFGFDAGYFFQVIWAVMGIWLVYLHLCVWRKKVNLWPLLIMIFFSGLDIVGWWIEFPDWGSFPWTEHLEWWAEDFQFSSMTTQLFWVFNQCIPAWLGVMLIMVHAEQNNRRNMLFVLSTLMFTSTFPFVGMLPFVVYFLLKGLKLDWKHIRGQFMEIITVQNMVGVFVIGIVSLLYLIGNVSAGNIAGDSAAFAGTPASLLAGAASGISLASAVSTASGLSLASMLPAASGFFPAFMTLPSVEVLLRYLIFHLLEFGLYAILISKFEYKNPVYYIIIGTLLLCPMIKVGGAHDFCMRASIPALFILMLLVIRSLEKMAAKKSFWLYPALIVLLLGAVTPFNEIHRTIDETIIRKKIDKTMLWPGVSLPEFLYYGNFSGDTDSIFMKYLAK